MDRRLFIAAGACCAMSASTARWAQAQPTPRFAEAIAYSSERGGANVLVVRHGVILAEHYTAGAMDTRWPIGAGTRMFAPLLAASLADDRILNLDEPAAMTLGDWAVHPVKSTISLRALLNGTSGLGFGRRDTHDVATALALEPMDSPGARFVADPAAYILFTEIARRKLEATGREPDPARYLTTRTLLPIGCVPIGWLRAHDGAPRLDDGAAVSARGWAQAGELLRREGVWRAQRLADDNVLREALRGSFAESRAGFGVWLATTGRDRSEPDVDSDLWRGRSPAPLDLAMAAGAGGQRLYLSPSEGLVIVRQSQSLDTTANWSDAQFLSLVWRGL